MSPRPSPLRSPAERALERRWSWTVPWISKALPMLGLGPAVERLRPGGLAGAGRGGGLAWGEWKSSGGGGVGGRGVGWGWGTWKFGGGGGVEATEVPELGVWSARPR